eukprot:1161770-Pelagomonas_calceolata.AAC.4
MVDGGSPVSFLNCANSPIILTDLKALAWRAEGVDDVRVCVSGLWGVCVSIRGPGEIAYAEQGCGGGTTCVEGVLFGWEPE